MKIASWNVNGIAACRRKGFLKFLADVKPDIMCCQEVRTRCSLKTPEYLQYWNNAERTGYFELTDFFRLSNKRSSGSDL